MDKNSGELDTAGWQVPSFTVKEFLPRRTKYCVCIPIINEGERIKQQLKEMQALTNQVDIILCDGGSTDGSMDHEYLATTGVRMLLTKTGPGKLSAQLRMGYSYALEQGYEGIITIDGNGKDGVDTIPDFVRELEAGWDFIQGSRFVAGGKAINTPKVRRFAVRFIHAPLLSLGAHHWFTDTTNGFRGYSRRMLLDERVQPFRDVFNTYELLAYLSVRAPRLKYKTKEIGVTRAYPAKGKVPTKISHFHGNIDLMKIVFKTIFGSYNP